MKTINQNKFHYLMSGLILISLLLASCAPVATPAPETQPITEPISAERGGLAAGESPIVDKIIKSGMLRVGVAVAPPWLLQDPGTNEYFGPAIDITEKLAEELGVEVQYVDTAWDVLVAGLQADKFDLAIAPLFATEKRKEVIDFVTYTSAGTCYFVKEGYDKVKTLDDLNNPDVTIVTYTGTGNEEGIKAKYPNATIRSIVQPPGGQPPLEEILAGRGDVGHMDSAIALLIEAKYPDLVVIGGAKECIANPDIPFPIGMGFNKNDPAFTAFLQSIVDGMQAEIDASILQFSTPEYLEQ